VNAEAEPILVGVGQLTHRPNGPHDVREPLALMAEAASLAADDAEAPAALAEIDSLTVINVISHSHRDAPGALAERLGAHPAERLYTAIGGNSPQWRVNETADRIARGEVRLALIAGAEALHGLQLARSAGVQLDWTAGGNPESTIGDARFGTNAVEQRHHAVLPAHVYPLFENALRAERGLSIAAHREQLARFCARFALVAADNPNAWFRDAKSAERLATVGADNRMIAFPYTKYMNAIMNVDQAAALLLTSPETARRLGIPERKWVYLWGSADAHDHWYVSDRVSYSSSPAIRLAGERALRQAGIEIGEIDFFDLYSCFPAAPQITAAMLGVAPDDPRTLTVTGGLGYHGGPGNNYAGHAIATMAVWLRERPGAVGLVSAVGWYLTKHSIGIYSSAPPPRAWYRDPPASYQALIDRQPHPPLAEEASGRATVETYTVVHDRSGNPTLAIVVARLDDGRRCWANITDPAILEHAEQVELVGQAGQVRHHASTRVNSFEV
jgi:acetyl-CoA C-acetyltransferase